MDLSVGERRLHKSCRDKVVWGVCGGLGEYFGVDPVVVRLAFVAAAVAGGASLLVYVLLAIALPMGGPEDAAAPRTAGGAALAGALLVGVGALLLAANVGWFARFDEATLWPVFLGTGPAQTTGGLGRPHLAAEVPSSPDSAACERARCLQRSLPVMP
jgi:phage shock protein C